jgi:hypothetical protein
VRDFFFGTGGVIAWSVMTLVFASLATYLWLIVWEVGGIRGTAMAILFSCLAVTTTGFALLLSHATIISSLVVGAVVTAAWWPILLSSIVLADLYAADRNGHRAFTTRTYLWYKRVTEGKEHDKHFTA